MLFISCTLTITNAKSHSFPLSQHSLCLLQAHSNCIYHFFGSKTKYFSVYYKIMPSREVTGNVSDKDNSVHPLKVSRKSRIIMVYTHESWNSRYHLPWMQIRTHTQTHWLTHSLITRLLLIIKFIRWLLSMRHRYYAYGKIRWIQHSSVCKEVGSCVCVCFFVCTRERLYRGWTHFNLSTLDFRLWAEFMGKRKNRWR